MMNSNQSLTNQQKVLKAKAELAKRELARRNLKNYVAYNYEGYIFNWHNELVINALERVARGELKRLIITMPPRSGKSELCSIQFPTWYLGNYPDKEIIGASYSSDLSIDFGRQAKNIMDSQEYSNIFPAIKIASDSRAKGKWNTVEGGGFFATGVGGSMTGKGADVLSIDDPFKNRQDADSQIMRDNVWSWYKSTARTRLSPEGAIILIMTRWHDDDLVGRILSNSDDDDLYPWEVIELKAIAEEDEQYRKKGEVLFPQRYSLENVLATKKEIGSYEFAALYQQNPIDNENQLFKKDWFKHKELDEVLKLNTRRFISIDTAIKQKEESDYTGISINFVDKDENWHIKTHHEKYTPTELIDYLFVLYNEYKPEIIGIEETSYTQAIKPFLIMEMRKRGKYLPIVELKHNQVQKEIRIKGLIPLYENGKIFHISEWCEDLEIELMRFPKGKHDDIADSLAYQLQIAKKYISEGSEKFHHRPKDDPYENDDDISWGQEEKSNENPY